MKIELSNGYVILMDFITHKASRDYQAALLKGTRMRPTGDVDESGKPKMEYDIDPNNADLANEALVLGMIEKVAVVTKAQNEGETGSEETIQPTREWLDRMPQTDFSKLERAAMEIKSKKDEDAKK